MDSARGIQFLTLVGRAVAPTRTHSGPRIVFACVVAALASPAPGEGMRIVRIDGTALSGTWIGSPDGRVLEFRTATGPTKLRLDALSSITFRGPVRSAAAKLLDSVRINAAASAQPEEDEVVARHAVYYLADGGRLFGTLIEPRASADSIMGRTPLGDPTELPFDRLAGVRLADTDTYPRAGEVFESALAARRPGEDLLITHERKAVAGGDPTEAPAPPAGPKSLPGRLISLGPESGSFVFSDRSRSFQTQRVYGIVFAAGVTFGVDRGAAHQHPVTIALLDGSTFTCRLEHSDMESVHLTTSLGASVKLALADISAMTIRSDRVVYVSDLKPVAQKTEGILHRPWPPRFDKNAVGDPISLDGRKYLRGLGVHSRTELVFEIDGDYEMFVATIGLDDSVRPRGSVVFRIIGDGEPLFDSGTVTGRDKPKDVRVDVTQVKTLGLIVDYGDELDIADHADWADARLLKPAPPSDATTN